MISKPFLLFKATHKAKVDAFYLFLSGEKILVLDKDAIDIGNLDRWVLDIKKHYDDEGSSIFSYKIVSIETLLTHSSEVLRKWAKEQLDML